MWIGIYEYISFNIEVKIVTGYFFDTIHYSHKKKLKNEKFKTQYKIFLLKFLYYKIKKL